ncbi:hypothetical protein PENSPDRAFT_646989 [Peniophora sp. CONT]|nr:hypothetical protein PENSPDRAFT_646989 [Peniophora sp. CONT]
MTNDYTDPTSVLDRPLRTRETQCHNRRVGEYYGFLRSPALLSVIPSATAIYNIPQARTRARRTRS